MLTNYVVTFWSGSRRFMDKRYVNDRAFYLKKHIKALHKFRHSLDRITIVVNQNIREPLEFRECLKTVPSHIQGAEVIILERPNIGMSYGAFSEVYGRDRTDFDYYLFIEDDQIFMQDHFDLLHIDLMNESDTTGYVCGLIGLSPLHASISTGLFRTEALEECWQEHGRIPHAKHSNEYGANEWEGQVGASQALIKLGWRLVDWRNTEYTPGFRYREGIRWKWNFPDTDWIRWVNKEKQQPLRRKPILGPL